STATSARRTVAATSSRPNARAARRERARTALLAVTGLARRPRAARHGGMRRERVGESLQATHAAFAGLGPRARTTRIPARVLARGGRSEAPHTHPTLLIRPLGSSRRRRDCRRP